MEQERNLVLEKENAGKSPKKRKKPRGRLLYMALPAGLILFTIVFAMISGLSAQKTGGVEKSFPVSGLPIGREKLEEIRRKLARLSDSNVKNEEPGSGGEAEAYVKSLESGAGDEEEAPLEEEPVDVESFINHSPEEAAAGGPSTPIVPGVAAGRTAATGEQEASMMVYSRGRPENRDEKGVFPGNLPGGAANATTERFFNLVKGIKSGVKNVVSADPVHAADPAERSRETDPEPELVLYNDLPPVRLFEGEFLDGVILNRIESQIADSPVVVSLAKDFFDSEQKYVVIPSGSRIIGNAGIVSREDQARMILTFHRVILPNGESFQFKRERMAGLAGDGSLGVVSNVNEHFWKRYRTALLFGVLDGMSALAQNKLSQTSRASFFVERTSGNFDRINSQLFSRYANILPTITVDAGHKIKVFVSEDVLISPFMPIKERGYAK